MRKHYVWTKVLTGMLLAMLIVPGITWGQGASPQTYKKEELAQMLAPIALYPDSLLAQVLMAATYPLEVVEAARWIAQNPQLQGPALDAALMEKGWDVSIKSLVHFPQVLQMMSDKLDWTSKLGNAFLSQQGEVMDTVQDLRVRAQAAGTLNTTKEQKVIVDNQIVRIEPAAPEVVYVPVYNPAVVYGPWWYPAYPPYPYYPWPDAVITAGIIGFTTGFFVGAAVNSWCGFGWRGHNVNVYINKTYHFNNIHHYGHIDPHGGQWHHDPGHRRGVAYRDPGTAQRYGQAHSIRADQARRDFRGYTHDGAGRSMTGTSRVKSDFSGRSTPKGDTGRSRDSLSRSTSSRAAQTRSEFKSFGGRSTGSAYQGVSNGKKESMASQRGQSSFSNAGKTGHAPSSGGQPGGGGSHFGSGRSGGGGGGSHGGMRR
ncbi:MAG: DUF3300 domain-containing protein [Deltaproteobacteria bacterium]|nr:DUF3300 domain-containing protein [Deltaproteobacteria bacterium]